ncbi:discoidin domain-containing protein [Paenibacillus sp. MZ04-78.2]|nr:discoidin domain-containing protein [Paenibacillus sp. MZ04-78.2]MCP3773012.1 discoidin domain-containing protein [Paenibacillus sp. MZ04-78.2]
MKHEPPLAKPTEQQLRWQDMELGMFCHFGINTFCDQEWGDGSDSPERFHPTALDAVQWIRTALDEPMELDHAVLMEDIRYGERIREYSLEAMLDGQWVELVRGSAVGHKKIDRFAPVRTDRIRLNVLDSAAVPKIRSMSVYCVSGGGRNK